MFENLFGWRKASKCKKLVQIVQCRLKVLKTKRLCIAKQLREDLSYLLKHGHHQTAFQRVEQLIVDEATIQSYDLLDHFCQFIIFQFRYIRRRRDCPNDINEAISTLVFSSPRFGELPELIRIRKLFGERYGQRFVITALELRSGNLVNPQIKDNLDYIKKVSDDLKYRLLAEITSASIKQGPLSLEYKPGSGQDQQESEDIDWLSCGDEVQVCDDYETPEEHELDTGREMVLRDAAQYIDTDRREMEIIYFDHIEEFASPSTKHDQRLFVFKSFGMIPLNHEAYYEIDISLEDRKLKMSRSSFMYEQPHNEYYSPCRHIHPKLPDYEELAAKFKALKKANQIEN